MTGGATPFSGAPPARPVPHPIQALVGSVLDGRYRCDALVGEGGMGAVVRGYHLTLDVPIAIKVLTLPTGTKAAGRSAFLRTFDEEAKLLFALSKRHVAFVQVLDKGMLRGNDGEAVPYLVLEWLEGEPLAAWMARRRARACGPLGLGAALGLLAPIAEALAVAHAEGIAHRDVTPSNVFLVRNTRGAAVKLLDLGIAKVMGARGDDAYRAPTHMDKVSGFTPAYAAPEQWDRARGATGPWTDVFAFALILVELVTGRRALGTQPSLGELALLAAAPERPTPRAGGARVSDAVEALFARALAVEPRARPASLGELWSELVRVARDSGEALEAPPRSEPPPAAIVEPSRAPLVALGASAQATRAQMVGSATRVEGAPPATRVEAAPAATCDEARRAPLDDTTRAEARRSAEDAPLPTVQHPAVQVPAVQVPAVQHPAAQARAWVDAVADANRAHAPPAVAAPLVAAQAVAPPRVVTPLVAAPIVAPPNVAAPNVAPPSVAQPAPAGATPLAAAPLGVDAATAYGAAPSHALGATPVTPAPVAVRSRMVLAAGAALVAGLVVGSVLLAVLRRDGTPSSQASAPVSSGVAAPPSPGVAPAAQPSASALASRCGANAQLVSAGGSVAYDFCLDTTEVTVGAYAACVQAGRCEPAYPDALMPNGQRSTAQFDAACHANAKWSAARAEQHPVNCVTRAQADAYCAYLDMRLPTSAEWKRGAGGDDGRPYPWGRTGVVATVVNGCGGECPGGRLYASDHFATTAPAGAFRDGASPYGVFDMAGNVAELTSDGPGAASVARGGSYFDGDVSRLRIDFEQPVQPGVRVPIIGFRCARALGPR